MKIVKTNSKTGFGLLLDDGKILPIDGSFFEKKTGKTWLKLPENSTNRKLVDAALCENDDYDLSTKTPRNTTQKINSKWQDFLTEDEREMLAQIQVNCEARMREQEKAKIEAEIARLQELAKML